MGQTNPLMEDTPQVQGTMWAQNREASPRLGSWSCPPPSLGPGGLYLQLQVSVNLRPQQAEEVGRSRELKP